MGINIDRTTKFLLTAIALLLAVLVFKPLFTLTSEAQAQTNTVATPIRQTATTDSPTYVGSRSTLISTIAINDDDRVRNLLVLNSARSFIVQYDNRFEIYRVSDITKEQLSAIFSGNN